MRTTTVGLEVLNRAECLRLLGSVPFGRIVFTLHAMPAIQPVNFLVDGERVVIRTSSDSKLAAASSGAVVAFEADDIDSVTRAGWSVTVVGHGSIIDDPDEVERLTARGLEAWATPGSDRFIAIQMEQLAGRWLHSPVATSVSAGTVC
jgi:nitroimidazol reductase NimA-like FMN-containing flavoprotein (pyridoxamine 5'-phosphate oxidase superfamily)